jgi:succinyl-diaminopimelate desuccinylase
MARHAMTSGRNAVQPIDPVELTRALIRCPSVTPKDEGALGVLEHVLTGLGFACTRLPFGKGEDRVDNLYARVGTTGLNFCFAGHTDVVPVGETVGWTRPPFEAEIADGLLYGRGAADMKGGIGAFVGAVSRFLGERRGFTGSISLLITGDEEGPAVNGTVRVLDWLKSQGETLDACLVGEPTNPERLGQMIKIGRRGSVTARLTVHGVQGHVAYPDRADNPIPKLIKVLDRLTAHKLDDGTEEFQPSNLEVVTVDVGNTATNVIPAKVTAVLNIRFNDLHTSASLSDWIRNECEAVLGAAAAHYDLSFQVTGEAFLTPPGDLSRLVARAVKSATGVEPELSTSGGTSDARFIKDMCPVVEFGLAGRTMHKVDECVPVADIETLSEIYKSVLDGYFPR